MQFSLRTTLITVAFLGIGIAWIVDHIRVVSDHDRVQRMLDAEQRRGLIAAESWEKRRQEVLRIANGTTPPDIPLLLFSLSDPDGFVSQTALDTLIKLRFSRSDLEATFSTADREAEMLFWVAALEAARNNNKKHTEFVTPRASEFTCPFGPDVDPFAADWEPNVDLDNEVSGDEQ